MYGPMKVSSPYARRGFTLIEILLVVVIVMISSALVLPMFQQNESTRLAGAARLLAADLSYAQMESISHGDDPRVVVFDTVNATYRIAPSSDPSTPIAGDAGMPYSVSFGTGRAASLTGVTIQSVSVGGDDTLGFLLYGQLDQTTDATVTLGSGNFSLTLTVDAVSGEVSIGQIH